MNSTSYKSPFQIFIYISGFKKKHTQILFRKRLNVRKKKKMFIYLRVIRITNIVIKININFGIHAVRFAKIIKVIFFC